MIDLGLVAGETSGDLLGAHFINALKQGHPDLRVAGIAGPRLVEAGVGAIYPSEKLAVNGYVEVLRHLPELLWIRSRITRYFLHERPRVFVGIDAPDFNFTLETKLRQAGIPTVHFVSPSIWAWRPERIHRIGNAVSHMLVVFPFEEQIYRDAGIPVSYVGHPLADVIPLEPDTAAARTELGLASGPVVALLPGSRLSEVTRHARLMLDAAVRIRRQHADAQFVLPAANEAAARLIRQASQGLDLPLHILAGKSHTALAACDVALVASGTATLEDGAVQEADGHHLPCSRADRLSDAQEGAAALDRPAEHPGARFRGAGAGAGSRHVREPGERCTGLAGRRAAAGGRRRNLPRHAPAPAAER